MTTLKTRTLASVAAIAAVAMLPAVAAAAGEDLSWIGQLPGIQAAVRKTAKSSDKSVYQVTSDVESTFQKIRDGLLERGWNVDKTASMTALVASVRAIKATKGAARVKIVATGAPGAATLAVQLEGDSSAASVGPAPAAPPPPARAAVPAVVAPAAANIVLLNDDVSGSYRCEENELIVNGDSCRLTVAGNCRAVRVNGDGNTIRVDGAVQAIDVLGDENAVTWSAAGNPTPPRVGNLGARNRVAGE